jgi:hypothetical protein
MIAGASFARSSAHTGMLCSRSVAGWLVANGQCIANVIRLASVIACCPRTHAAFPSSRLRAPEITLTFGH